jgi:hypothetical protein
MVSYTHLYKDQAQDSILDLGALALVERLPTHFINSTLAPGLATGSMNNLRGNWLQVDERHEGRYPAYAKLRQARTKPLRHKGSQSFSKG